MRTNWIIITEEKSLAHLCLLSLLCNVTHCVISKVVTFLPATKFPAHDIDIVCDNISAQAMFKLAGASLSVCCYYYEIRIMEQASCVCNRDG